MELSEMSSTKEGNSTSVPVVIIGGGPVGMSTALGLAHHGVRSLLIEQNAGTVRESRAFGVWTRTLEIIRDWGSLEALQQAGTLYKKLEPVDARNERILFSFDFGILDEITAAAGAMILPQNATEGVLRELVRQHEECEVRIAQCLGVEQDAEGVYVHIVEDGGERVIQAQFAVGCDGAHSIVRKSLGLELQGTTYPTRMVLSDERIEEQGLGHLRFAVHKSGFLASVRFAPNLWRVMVTVLDTLNDEEAIADARQAARVRDLFGDRTHETIWISQFRIYRRHVQRFRVGRILLAGDAAHLNSPAGGQGMNSGIQDAENAAWKLAAALRGGDMDRLLESYHKERWEAIVSHVEQNSDRNTSLEFNMPAFLKPTLLALLGYAIHARPISIQFARNFSMLDLTYTDSPLLIQGHKLVGTRLDDLKIDGSRRISDCFSGHTGILACNTPDIENSIGGVPVVHIPSIPRAWGLHKPACIILRPDRHVGAVIENPTNMRIAYALQTTTGQVIKGASTSH